MQFFGGIHASGRIIHDSHALRTEQMPNVVKPTRAVKPNAVSLGAPDKFRGRGFAENIDWESLLNGMRQGIASSRRRVAPALLLC